MKSRRNFIKKVAIAGVTSSLPTSLLARQSSSGKMIHQVFFWLNDGVDVSAFKKEASKLGLCPTVDQFYIGEPAATEEREVVDASYQVACTLFFDSLNDQNKYQVDPLHLEFIEKNSMKWNKVKVYDFVI
ncbi:Stress responsive A/B Barrel Domain-containing protein [Belliella baltica DSM 15883]|uniref:Stress responsive A/B Barrel Domain-containing protein n=1 Tax=Belliella baltica (strain DSM 15883 / CIP 108006 / LMG 21964 / BA134) TaxID=866536 RepID=I3Z8Y8_BELBD|nr:Dabb family protein [Belliella baltica]AFL85706.1 Stress responsive A/B Barrel Domain-containing protein [Belliella baltica DSM 15883]